MWFPWSDSIKTRLCRFLLHHYIGHYLEEKLSLDQMSIELYAGKGTIHNVALNTETLNDLLDQLNLPFEITEGFIGRVSIDVPWQALVSSSTNVEVEGLEITVQPKHYCATATTSMMDSVRNMTSSLVLAQHVMEEEVDTKLEGLEAFAHMIESVLSRVTCSFSNTAIRLQSRDTSIGVGLELVIDKINYFDEREQEVTSVLEEDANKYIPTSIAHKVILWSGISIRVSETSPTPLFSYFNESDEDREEETPPQTTQPNVIAKFLGEQEIKIHLKINDQLPGPKLDMECNVGSIHAMLSPHDVHILSDLIHSINTTLSDSRKEATPLRCQKMSNDDFAKLEQELHTNHIKGRGLSHEGFESDFFYSMHSGPTPFPNLDLPPLDTDMQSIPLGGAADKPVLNTTSHRATPKQQKHSELLEDQIVVQLNVRYIAVTLLHQNLTSVSVSGDLSQPNLPIEPMVTLSAKYFAEVADQVTNNYENDSACIRASLNKVCPHDHLFLVSVNTNFRLELMTTTQHIDTSASLSIVRCEIEEALFSSLTETNLSSPNIQPVLLLDQRETRATSGSIYHPTSPALNLIFKSTTANEEYRTNFQLDLGSLSIIADITMLDRVGVFHKPQNSKRTVHLPTVPGQDLHLPTASMVRQDIYEQVMGEDWSNDRYQEIFVSTCTCNSISITFRFPIPDMRPSAQRTWWAPALRADYVVIHIDEATAEYNTLSAPASFTAEFTKLNCEYLENSDSDPIQFLLVGSLEEEPDRRPRIVIKTSQVTDSSLLVAHSPSPPPSLDNILHMPESKPSPFASKRVMYESQELVMPGSRPEMDLFEKGVKENSRLSLEFCIPELLIYLQDKQFFEVLYNRIFTDLCLWTPGCPVVQETNVKLEPEIFKMCTSTAHRESDSDEEENGGEYNAPVYRSPQHSSSWLSLSFDIQQSRVSLNCTVPPTPEQSPLHVNPTGELLLEIINTHIFTVMEHEGDPDTSYFSVSSETGTLLHGNNSPVGVSTSTLTGSFINTTQLNEILYTLPSRLTNLLPDSNKDYGFFTLASKVFFDQSKNIKEITLAVALQNVCHRVYVKPREETFALQLMEFFDVQDYTVPGYKLPLSVTSLHTHLWNLAVDYRPLYLPWKLLLTVQSLGISSNLALESSVTSLRVLLEDLSLYLAPGSEDETPVTDYVKLIDLDLFELMIKMLISPNEKSPQFEIDIKNNMLHIGTCADACAALRDLLVYISSEGDLYDPGEWTNTSSEELPRTTRVREHSSSDDIPSMMKSAVNTEIKRTSSSNHELSSNKTELVTPAYSRQTFTFPDDCPTAVLNTENDIANAVDDDSEDLPISVKTPYSTLNSVSEAMQSAMDEESEDQEFFVVESELVETMVAKGQFVIKKLVDTPCKLVEDHLTLPEDTDQLKSPPHFPLPLSRITIKELSLQWIMYGGNDFPAQEPRSLPGTPRSDRSRTTSESGGRERRNSPNKNHEVGRNKSEQMEFQINKIKLRFEQYPETALQIFRLCLILTDVEIRDKMGSSNFNKFLYQYSTDENPRPSRTPMLSVKVVHNRSEELTEDAIIRVSLLPLRFNIDQDALIFMFNFFNNMSEIAPYRRARVPTRASPSNPPCTTSTTRTVAEEPLSFGKSSAVVGKTTACAVSERGGVTAPMTSSSRGSMTSSASSSLHARSTAASGSVCGTTLPESNRSTPDIEDTPTFIKAFVFSPEVPIRVDYKGKNIRGDKNLISNPVTNLLIGLAQLNCSELRLKSLCYRQGLLGYSRLLEWATNQWVNDIKTSQLPSILGGVGPMHSFIQLFSGVVDLVYLPVQQYREDGRIVRGLQRGANSFTHSTAVSLLQLTTKLFSSIQCVAEVTYDLVSPSQHRRSSPSFQHPADLREGLVNAYQVVTTDISSRASSIQHAALYNHTTKGITSAVGGVLREIPPTLLLPFITLPKVITQLSNGAQNHLKPSTLKEREEKYRST
ncbi:autophagy-related protein 2 homolog A-like isoform X2 [Bolinopsis microptera]|uniref:autophagy-related protein 2 homolog A-like isoform X2 n=1 Tax=Bolinopsis microptera TaxID=2820187 RepID=UPI003079077B